jgi:hypothetical protein
MFKADSSSLKNEYCVMSVMIICVTRIIQRRPILERAGANLAKIGRVSIDGGEMKRLTEFETDRIFGFDWSRDGKYLACVRRLWATNVVLIKNFR